MKLRQFFLSICICIGITSSSTRAQAIIEEEIYTQQQIKKHFRFESNKGDSILYFKGYSVIYSYVYNLPRYVFNCLTVDQLKTTETRPAVKRSNSFYPYQLPNGSYSATNADYYKSGYDRGHMVPAGDFTWNKELKNETFFYVNINPQNPKLNRGIWANLENRIRKRVLRISQDAHVVTGAIFTSTNKKQIGPNNLCVPTAFFKIVYFEKKNEMFAFIFDNTIDQYYDDITDFQVSVDFIEKITGEDFFDILDNRAEAKLESVIVKFDE